ncbi:hypothetical protein MGG_16135 [Pyricularia oryzae 70-15]|uniref:Uncharacterized protein n=4 Tax=Pyricularia oryzae TaxID=318829 RepID=G4MK97_PYRO7|nr:uncharacterized protein MGG_16135 [Pyricularia oryzae 70-15]ELQ35344.1 hypothetical protein OOU_Y34scaffold00712g17 [Pyricularia oryzae Y34]KAI7930200.1 hypothetical protein M9X92_000975 [Pyricularia oryzae]EHA56688.1 hypothetical protein MGG_16135 [Pyricularia oryzae 70-15]KAI7930267.1 hypothetical protein M0657_001736 [Pyricularia oryzae]QBZ53896.1 hypothetical protein PoMZ_09586 [Pyricularia oryzae]
MVPRVPFELELSYFRGREPKTYRHERRATSVLLVLYGKVDCSAKVDRNARRNACDSPA